MNDFTKDELEEMLLGLRHFYVAFYKDCIPQIKNDISSGVDIINKLQSMIDNYCEHDWRKGVHLFNDIYCTKCKKHFEVNNPE